MSNEETMSIDERYKYLGTMQRQYPKVTREERGQLLDHMQQ
jgi:hypothetical protein